MRPKTLCVLVHHILYLCALLPYTEEKKAIFQLENYSLIQVENKETINI